MKLKEKKLAVQLRKSGYSITTIAHKLSVSKGSVSAWVRDVYLTKETLAKVRKRSHTAAAVEKRRSARLRGEDLRRSKIVTQAQSQIKQVSNYELFVIGIALYWGEGSKRKRGVVEFTNSDPEMIRVMMRFLSDCCSVPAAKFRGHVYLHAHLDEPKAEKYWSKISGIPRKQFHKTSIQKNRQKVKKDTLPYGTFAIVVCDTELKLSIDGWISGLSHKINTHFKSI